MKIIANKKKDSGGLFRTDEKIGGVMEDAQAG